MSNDIDDLIDAAADEQADNPTAANRSRPHVTRTLAALALRRALGRDLTRRLASSEGPGLAIVVQAPGAEWVEPLRRAARRVAGACESFARTGSQRTNDKPENGNDDVAAALACGRHCVGISHAPERYLPSSLVTAADMRIEVRAPGPALIALLLRICVGGPSLAIPENAAAGLGFHDIVCAFRQGADPSQVLAYLAAASSSRTRVTATDDTPTLQNLAGYGEARTWGLDLADGIASWRRGDIRWGDLSSAAVLHGPPGCGKTLFARSLARTLEVPIVVTSIGELFASTAGYLDSVIKGLQSAFDAARANTPSILFIDEMDGLPDRNTLSPRGRDWWTPVINFALTLLDGAVTSREGIVLLGATNHAARLDQALIRPGRFDRLIEITPPGPAGLAGILRHHLGDALPGADLEFVAGLQPDGTGAMAAQWARDARAAARAAVRPMTLDDLVAVVAPPDPRTPEDVWRTCVHEAGHAAMHVYLRRALTSVTTVVAGMSGGRTIGEAGSPSPTAEQMEESVRIALAGRAAEEIVLGSVASGAIGDLAMATATVAAMYVAMGLGDSLLYRAGPGEALAVLSADPALRRKIEAHVTKIYAEVRDVIRREAAGVRRLAEELRLRRALTGAEAGEIIAGRRARNRGRGL